MGTGIRIKIKSEYMNRHLNHYRVNRDKRIFPLFEGQHGMVKRVSWALV